MEEIKVGEYVRTPNGIRKVKSTDNSDTYRLIIWFEDGGCIEQYLCRDGEWRSDDREKHSFNIIDLIEVGDYVNGLKVIEKREDFHCVIPDNGFNYYEHDIKTILTKEQYTANCYEVK